MEPDLNDYEEIFSKIQQGYICGKFYDERDGKNYNIFWEIVKTSEKGQTRIIINKWSNK